MVQPNNCGQPELIVFRKLLTKHRPAFETFLKHAGWIVRDRWVDTLFNKITAETKVIGLLNGEIVCYGKIVRTGSTAYFTDVTVRPGMRLRGVGTRLVKHLLGIARRMGCQSAELNVLKDNAAAIGLYQKLSFKRAGSDQRCLSMHLIFNTKKQRKQDNVPQKSRLKLKGRAKTMRAFVFRPSSHSTDYSIIGTFKTQKQAAEACAALEKLVEEALKEGYERELDWSPEDAHVSIEGTEVTFSVYTDGDADPAEEIMRKHHAERVEGFEDLQRLTITVALPPKITPNLIALILDPDDARAVKYLNDNCEEATETTHGRVRRIVWHYRGDGIYDEDADALYLGGKTKINLEKKKQWTVEEE
jgi:GNAT superfamily N-acetyltransferase